MKKLSIVIFFLPVMLICLGQIVPVSTKHNNYSGDYYFGIPLPGLDSVKTEDFRKGEQLFNHLFTAEDNITLSFNGLSCTSCHNTPIPGGSGIYSNTFVPFLVQNDSSETTLHKFSFHNNCVTQNRLPQDHIIRKTPALFGLGLLECINEQTVMAAADPDDLNKDGISGKINYLDKEKKVIGRFGWKASSSSVKDFVEKAYINEMGINQSNNLTSLKGYSYQDISHFVTQYLTYLSPPFNINELTYSSRPGLNIFTQIGCQKCHLDYAVTKSDDKFLNNIRIRPFTDLLLHNLTGTSTASQGNSPSFAEYKTPTLWGLNSTGPPYMHDGGADGIEEAIRFHNGEATTSKRNFLALLEKDKLKLIAFLKSL